MGKHERKLIEEAEKIIVRLLNKERINEDYLKNIQWGEYAMMLAAKIMEEYPDIISAEHLGNRYDNTGDILLKLPKKEIYIEIKMSESKAGIGTMANISQDALTENGLFLGNPKKWSEFRRDQNHELWLNRFLNKYKKYPKSITLISNKSIKRETKARYLRDLANDNLDKQAINILKNIKERDRLEKISYLKYLKKQQQALEMIRKFFILLKMGIHRDEEIGDLIYKDSFFNEIKNLYVYYANFNGKGVIVRKEDVGNKIKAIIENILTFKIIFPEQETHCKIIGVTDTRDVPLLQVVYHWKNIAQGIKTPCLNIFDLTAKDSSS